MLVRLPGGAARRQLWPQSLGRRAFATGGGRPAAPAGAPAPVAKPGIGAAPIIGVGLVGGAGFLAYSNRDSLAALLLGRPGKPVEESPPAVPKAGTLAGAGGRDSSGESPPAPPAVEEQPAPVKEEDSPDVIRVVELLASKLAPPLQAQVDAGGAGGADGVAPVEGAEAPAEGEGAEGAAGAGGGGGAADGADAAAVATDDGGQSESAVVAARTPEDDLVHQAARARGVRSAIKATVTELQVN